MLTMPLCSLAFGAEEALGLLLPLLCAGDAFSLWHYWRKWDVQNLRYLLPGVVGGVILGSFFLGSFSPRQLNILIGCLALGFVVWQLVKERVFAAEGILSPGHRLGVPCGIGIGLTSTFAHGAGPVAALFLVPQRMPKEIYVGTTVLLFTWVNWIKMPFFIARGFITEPLLLKGLILLPLVPAGVWLGVWLNRRIPEVLFSRLVYILTFLTGVQLVLGWGMRK